MTTFRTDGAWGLGKGAPLTAEEIDENFFDLVTRAEDLETNPAQPVNIDSISMDGNSITVHMTDASIRGPFTLPVAYFKWRGRWQADTEYSNLDLVYVDDEGLFIVKTSHTSSASFPPQDDPLFYSQWIGQATIYDMCAYFPGLVGEGMDSESPLMQTIIGRPLILLEASPGFVYARVAPEIQDFYAVIRKNGTAIGFAKIFIGSNEGEISLTNNAGLAAGDVLTIDQPTIEPETETGTGTDTETETPTEGVPPMDLSITFLAIRGTLA